MIRSRAAFWHFYDAVKRPVWSPPAWVLGSALLAIGAARLWGDLRLFGAKKRKRASLALEAVSWGSLALAGPAFFGLRSPRITFATNVVHAGATLASVVLATRVDRKASLALAPTAAWLGYALPLGAWIASRNADPFLRKQPLRSSLRMPRRVAAQSGVFIPPS